MDAASVASDFIAAANATTAFAIFQNIAFSYGLMKRELPFRLDGKWRWILAGTGFLWNSIYVVVISWCTHKAIQIAQLPGGSLRDAVELLGWGKAVAAGFFGFAPVWIILIYDYKPFWSQRPAAPKGELPNSGVRAFNQMVAIFGPSCPSKVTPTGTTEIVIPALEPLMVDAKTLAEALAAYGRQYEVRFRPYDGSDPAAPFADGELPKYFYYEKADGSSYLVDIHIERGKEDICPKQDLSVGLEPSDRVNIGPLAC